MEHLSAISVYAMQFRVQHPSGLHPALLLLCPANVPEITAMRLEFSLSAFLSLLLLRVLLLISSPLSERSTRHFGHITHFFHSSSPTQYTGPAFHFMHAASYVCMLCALEFFCFCFVQAVAAYERCNEKTPLNALLFCLNLTPHQPTACHKRRKHFQKVISDLVC